MWSQDKWEGTGNSTVLSDHRQVGDLWLCPRYDSTSVYNANLMTSVMRPDPRYELALASQVPHIQTEYPDTSAVAVTNCLPNAKPQSVNLLAP